ncbi:hypothetical protein B0H15DRAFT_1026366 [Mycena belliarum]|uniref:Uncharacterized protein n=1 Tax=Mycena belliarum TaxID=1033014 RepID=A0AAD6XG87_9AGAR|nr:hypothetical protein B0H15DRAFT_1026366 [Mycena belliae]
MPFSSPFHRDRLLRTKEYTASSLFPSSFSFAKVGKGHILKLIVPGPIDPDAPAPPDAILITIGVVSESSLWLSPTGNWNPNSQYGKTLDEAKYTFIISKPVNDPTFAPDFPVSITALKKTQTSISKSGNNKWFIVEDGSDDALRFATPVFQPKVPDAEIDIHTWPVKTDARSQLESISKSHSIRDFIVFDTDNSRIEPLEIANKLKGEIEQIVILRPPPAQPPSPYKKANKPYRPPAMSPDAIHAQEQLSVKLFAAPISLPGPSNLSKPVDDKKKKRTASSEPDEPDPKRIKGKARERRKDDHEKTTSSESDEPDPRHIKGKDREHPEPQEEDREQSDDNTN